MVPWTGQRKRQPSGSSGMALVPVPTMRGVASVTVTALRSLLATGMPHRFTTRDRTLACPAWPSWITRCLAQEHGVIVLGLQGGGNLPGHGGLLHGGDHQQRAVLFNGDGGARLQGRAHLVPQQVCQIDGGVFRLLRRFGCLVGGLSLCRVLGSGGLGLLLGFLLQGLEAKVTSVVKVRSGFRARNRSSVMEKRAVTDSKVSPSWTV